MFRISTHHHTVICLVLFLSRIIKAIILHIAEISVFSKSQLVSFMKLAPSKTHLNYAWLWHASECWFRLKFPRINLNLISFCTNWNRSKLKTWSKYVLFEYLTEILIISAGGDSHFPGLIGIIEDDELECDDSDVLDEIVWLRGWTRIWSVGLLKDRGTGCQMWICDV